MQTTTSMRSSVKREDAENYLLLMLISFAASVIITRLYLDITGYPQIGNGELHIAHVLWGGLLLFIGTLLPLILANRWVYPLTAICSGLGVGLFIDEVGKFITQSNDYFYPLAAPIIYAFFLLTVVVYLRVKRPFTESSRANLYRALDLMTEVIDHNLDPIEQTALKQRLNSVAQMNKQPEHQLLAKLLLDFITAQEERVRVDPGWIYRTRKRLEDVMLKYLTPKSLRVLLTLGLGLLAAGAISQLLLLAFVMFVPNGMEELLAVLVIDQPLIRGQTSAIWFVILMVLDGVVGLILTYAVMLLMRGQNVQGGRWGLFALTLSLTTVNLLLFYYNQFAAVGSSLLHFSLMLGLLLYQRYFHTDFAKGQLQA